MPGGNSHGDIRRFLTESFAIGLTDLTDVIVFRKNAAQSVPAEAQHGQQETPVPQQFPKFFSHHFLEGEGLIGNETGLDERRASVQGHRKRHPETGPPGVSQIHRQTGQQGTEDEKVRNNPPPGTGRVIHVEHFMENRSNTQMKACRFVQSEIEPPHGGQQPTIAAVGFTSVKDPPDEQTG
jgi:hypothetical protein